MNVIKNLLYGLVTMFILTACSQQQIGEFAANTNTRNSGGGGTRLLATLFQKGGAAMLDDALYQQVLAKQDYKFTYNNATRTGIFVRTTTIDGVEVREYDVTENSVLYKQFYVHDPEKKRFTDFYELYPEKRSALYQNRLQYGVPHQ